MVDLRYAQQLQAHTHAQHHQQQWPHPYPPIAYLYQVLSLNLTVFLIPQLKGLPEHSHQLAMRVIGSRSKLFL